MLDREDGSPVVVSPSSRTAMDDEDMCAFDVVEREELVADELVAETEVVVFASSLIAVVPKVPEVVLVLVAVDVTLALVVPGSVDDVVASLGSTCSPGPAIIDASTNRIMFWV